MTMMCQYAIYLCNTTNCTPCTSMSKLCTLLGGTAATSTWDINRRVRSQNWDATNSQLATCELFSENIHPSILPHSKHSAYSYSCSTLEIHRISLSSTAVLTGVVEAPPELSQEWRLLSRLHQSKFTGIKSSPVKSIDKQKQQSSVIILPGIATFPHACNVFCGSTMQFYNICIYIVH